MDEPLLLDRSALAAFENCPRRFQLRYLEKLPWPASPLDREQGQAVERGSLFHRLVERHFLDLPVEEKDIVDHVVRGWWQRFVSSGLAVPDGIRWPEHRLTIPIGSHFLTGRFDLLVVGKKNGQTVAHLFDWKTSRPRTAEELRSDWQTRVYLALVAESGQVFAPASSPLSADRVSITYWYPGEPDQPRVLSYSKEWHQANWAHITDLVEAIDSAEPGAVWPLTYDLSRCRFCMYQSYCGRQHAGTASFLSEVSAPYEAASAVLLEPQTP